MSYLVLSDSFEYLCYGYMVIINIFILSVRGQNRNNWQFDSTLGIIAGYSDSQPCLTMRFGF